MKQSTNNSGILYIIALPIGNYSDISNRMIETLRSVEIIACEDTRVTGLLLQHLNLKKKLLSYYEHVEQNKSDVIIDHLLQGTDIALVSDAGTPLISDPGYVVVRKAREKNIPVIPVPGPSAVMSALSVSGMSSNKFYFAGFLPKVNNKLSEEIFSWKDKAGSTIVFFESGQRIKDTLQVMETVLSGQKLFLAREMTKTYEQYLYGQIKEVLEQLSETVKGEITCVIEIPPKDKIIEEKYVQLAHGMMSKGMHRKDVVQLLSENLNLPKNQLKKILED
ncbi:MAG TPA: 16S rRNA (cytidine(1402)-2'-O)-methyltransferase [Candidatus Margulisbacteria bacterium]|nr:16S rRNA (cytidine(1402)-2'-O)-methyltransferase [Candidatus Margulisiibacteriota bacterium]